MDDCMFGYALLVHGDRGVFERATHSPLPVEVVRVYKRALNMPCARPVLVQNRLDGDFNPEVAVVAFAMHDGDLTNDVKIGLADLMSRRTVLGFVHLSQDGATLLATYVGAGSLRQLSSLWKGERGFFERPPERPL